MKKTEAALGLGIALGVLILARAAAEQSGATLGLSKAELATIVALSSIVGARVLAGAADRH